MPGEAERGGEVVLVPVDEILIPEERVTSVYDEELEEELEASIRRHGILQPLQLAKVGERLVLVDGLHRLKVAKRLGMRAVPCIIKEMSDDQLLVANLIMNRQRGKSNPAQEALVIKKLVDEHGRDLDEVARALGMSRQTCEKYYRIASHCSDKVLEYLASGLLSVGGAYWLSFLEDREKQDEIAELGVKWGYTVEQYKSAVLSITSPAVETPYVMLETGEMRPRPIRAYPCGKEVDPSEVVMIPFHRECWPLVEEALRRLCDEGFFYEEEAKERGEEGRGGEAAAPPVISEAHERRPEEERKRGDWFLEGL